MSIDQAFVSFDYIQSLYLGNTCKEQFDKRVWLTTAHTVLIFVYKKICCRLLLNVVIFLLHLVSLVDIAASLAVKQLSKQGH